MRYGKVLKFADLVALDRFCSDFCQYLFHKPIAEALDLRLEGKEFAQNALIPLHLVFGGTIFLLAVTRL